MNISTLDKRNKLYQLIPEIMKLNTFSCDQHKIMNTLLKKWYDQ